VLVCQGLAVGGVALLKPEGLLLFPSSWKKQAKRAAAVHILLNFGCVPLKRCKLATLRHTSFLYAPLRQNSSRKICKAVLPWRTLHAGDASATPGYGFAFVGDKGCFLLRNGGTPQNGGGVWKKSCPSCKSCPRNYGNVTPWRIPMECRPASHPFSTKRLSLRDILMTAVR